MNTLEVRYSTLRNAFTLFGVLFYIQVIGFFSGLADTSNLDLAEKDLEGNAVNQICGLITLLVPLFFFIRNKVFLSKSFYRNNAFLLVFILCLAVSISWSHDPMLSFKRFVALISVVFFAGFIAYNYSLEKIAFMLGCLIGAAALFGLILALVRPDVAFINGGVREGAFKGIFPDKNAGARINAIAILLLLPMIRQGNPWAIICSLFSLIAIALAQSATATALIVAGTVSYWYFLTLIRLHINRSWPAFLGTTIVYLLICFFLYGNYTLLLELTGRDPSLTDRTLIWDLLTPLIDAEFLKGYGFGAFWSSPSAEVFISRWGYIGNAHNGYIETLLNGGIVQLIALLLMLIEALLKHYRAVMADQSARFHVSAMVIVGSFMLTNYVAYVVPNYRSAEFLVFCVLALSFRHHHAKYPVLSAATLRQRPSGEALPRDSAKA
ncbi:O-antigen ligase [Pseudomonas frederiksbergensis]|jgi:O-antigen ligase|uniref:O-antigen ligase family protein n=1 Tax=Pseudomonas TaxID=286 RepID=UPI00110E1155|nr:MULTISPECIES: O-antigen ligase family protein [unclassified Pseudomonas]MBD9615929.1 O-antigen ligase family protein [Pseudomonas sp. PDM07]QDV95396.1 O-antigen ligase family protein [Pseudomonas sp. ATCC 43928]